MPPKQNSAVATTAYAKINLYLHVTGKRADGYHELDSLIAFAGVGDKIFIESGNDLSLLVTGPRADTVPRSDDNLVLKAARMLATCSNIITDTKITTGAKITLDKHLPAAAGIGGGSADAAATLIGLTRFWNLPCSVEELCELGLILGADVPICVYGKAALVSGIGEVITPAPSLPLAWLVLVNPGVPVETATVFAARSGGFTKPAPLSTAPKNARELAAMLKDRLNDLTEAAISVAPVIRHTLKALDQCPNALLARLSGSGATCFALFTDEHQAHAGARDLKKDHPDWWVEAAPLLTSTSP